MLSRAANHVYVVTIVWFTMSITLGFIETPLRFSSPLDRADILEIGHRVFHALNYCEIGFCIIVAIGIALAFRSRPIVAIFGCVVTILFVQTLLLFFILDPRTLLVISGGQPPPSHVHLVYIVLEILKIGILISLTSVLIRASRKNWVDLLHHSQNK